MQKLFGKLHGSRQSMVKLKQTNRHSHPELESQSVDGTWALKAQHVTDFQVCTKGFHLLLYPFHWLGGYKSHPK